MSKIVFDTMYGIRQHGKTFDARIITFAHSVDNKTKFGFASTPIYKSGKHIRFSPKLGRKIAKHRLAKAPLRIEHFSVDDALDVVAFHHKGLGDVVWSQNIATVCARTFVFTNEGEEPAVLQTVLDAEFFGSAKKLGSHL